MMENPELQAALAAAEDVMDENRDLLQALGVWVPLAALLAIHDCPISRLGGASGTRDPELLEADCARPLNQAGYGDPDAYTLAAAYAFGIAKALAFC